jgi:hypothetical protein
MGSWNFREGSLTWGGPALIMLIGKACGRMAREQDRTIPPGGEPTTAKTESRNAVQATSGFGATEIEEVH